MASLVSINIAVSRAGVVSRVLKTNIGTPLKQLGEVCRTVLLKVARAHPHGMANQEKRAAERANEASPACVQPYHPARMIPGQPHGQWPQQQPHVLPQEQTGMQHTTGVDAQGTMPFIIDLSTEADDDEGDL